MKILVAIPVYDSKLQIQSVDCLMKELALSMVSGDELQVRFLPSCSHPAMGRNQLAHEFMQSDCERLIFLDADITFEVGSILKLAHMPLDFVGGAYRYKTDKETYPVDWIPNEDLMINRAGLLEVETLPGGFLSLSRKVFSTLKEAHPERHYTHQGLKTHCYFQMPFKDGHLYGEDSHFCQEWRAAGGKVYLDPGLTLTHWQFDKPYVGNIGNFIKQYNQKLEGDLKCQT